MLPGPIFQFELLRASRRPRLYSLRVGYAILLLLVLAQNYYAWSAENGGSLTITQVSLFAETTFYSFAVYQEIALLALTPALVAACIAEERQRKTIHYVLASDLGSAEIIAGKLAARLTVVITCILVGFPVLCLLSLMGGIDPRLILLVFGAAFSTTFMLSGLSIWLSATSRRVRDALSAAYIIELVWLIFPFVAGRIPYGNLPAPLVSIFQTLIEWVSATNPIYIGWRALWARGMGGTSTLAQDLLIVILSHSLLGSIWVLLAILRLRPVFRRQEGEQRWSLFRRGGADRPVSRRFRLPPCGDDPMLWKELWTSRPRGLVRFLGIVARLGLAAMLVYGTLEVYMNVLRSGNPGVVINYYIAAMTSALALLSCVGALTHAAGSVTGEIESDTWIALTSTTLDRREILRAKLWGALWRSRGPVFLILGLWAFGFWTQWMSLTRLAFVVPVLAVFLVFSAIMGLALSMTLPNTHRAQVLGVGLFLLLNITGQAALGLFFRFPPAWFPACMPVTVHRVLDEQGPLQWMLDQFIPWVGNRPYAPYFTVDGYSASTYLVVMGLNVLGYAVAAYLLWRLCLRRFETLAGRPRKSRRSVASSALDPASASLDPSVPPA